jgi:TRAP-type C4-dicarboxylate transport system permease small subunit
MRQLIDKTETAIKAVSLSACIIGGWILIALSVAIGIEVVLRKVFSLSLQGIDEYGGYALAVTSALGMAYCFYEYAHIRIDLVVRRFPTKWLWASSFLAITTLGIVAGLFAVKAWSVVLESWEFGAYANTSLRTPMHIPQGLWATGFSLFFIAVMLRVIKVLIATSTNDQSSLERDLGLKSQTDKTDNVAKEKQ